MSSGIEMSSYVVGELSNMTISISISSIIETSDVINIQVPTLISLSSLSIVKIGSNQIPTFTVNNNIVSFTGSQIVTSIPVTIILS